MGWVEWGMWGITLVGVGTIISYNLKVEAASKANMRRMNYIIKYAMFSVVAAIFMAFLSEFTGRSGGKLFLLFFGIGLIPVCIGLLRFLGLLPPRVCRWLDQVPGKKP